LVISSSQEARDNNLSRWLFRCRAAAGERSAPLEMSPLFAAYHGQRVASFSVSRVDAVAAATPALHACITRIVASRCPVIVLLDDDDADIDDDNGDVSLQ